MTRAKKARKPAPRRQKATFEFTKGQTDLASWYYPRKPVVVVAIESEQGGRVKLVLGAERAEELRKMLNGLLPHAERVRKRAKQKAKLAA